VVAADGVLAGIVSAADLIDIGSAGHRAPPSTVAEVMTPGVFTVDADADAARAARLMLERGYRSLPVTDGAEVVGIVSRGDLLRALARADDAIRADVERLVREHARLLAELEIRVADGVVTFAGELPSVARPLPEALARDVPGTLTVRFEPPG
jgi:CBS-domain-containing membrane protein